MVRIIDYKKRTNSEGEDSMTTLGMDRFSRIWKQFAGPVQLN